MCVFKSPKGAILLPSSPLELIPIVAGLLSPTAPGLASDKPAGRTSPSLSRASLLLQDARLSVLLLLLPLCFNIQAFFSILSNTCCS